MYQTTVKKKYSEHTNMIFHVKRSQFHFFKRTCFNKVYKLDVYFSHNQIQNYFLLFSYLDFKILHAKVYPDFCP